MSRTYGKSNITYDFYEELLDTKIPKYKKDKRESSWEAIRDIDNKIKLYLPEQAIELLGSKRTVILRQPFRRKTISVIPAEPEGVRAIVFPRNAPYKENEYEYMYYLGRLLSVVNPDDMFDFYVPGEYDEVIPLLLEYLYVKEHGDTDQFSINYFNELKKNAKRFMRNYNTIESDAKSLDYAKRNSMLFDPYYAEQVFNKDKNNFEQLAAINMRVLASFDALLNIADRNLSVEEIKELIDKLMTNKTKSRETVIRDMDIDTLNYPRIRKELKKFKK